MLIIYESETGNGQTVAKGAGMVAYASSTSADVSIQEIRVHLSTCLDVYMVPSLYLRSG